MKMEAKRKEATRYKTDRVTGRVVEKEPGDPTIEEVSPIEAKFLARVSELHRFLHIWLSSPLFTP